MSNVHPLFGNALRMPPTNLEAEQSVIGSLMANPKTLHVIADFLSPDHFADPLHGRIFAEQRRRILGGGIADAVSLKDWFAQEPDAAQVGGTGYLARLLGAWVGPGTTVPYARSIHEAWMRRQLIAVGEDVVNEAFAASQAPDEVVSGAIDKLETAFGVAHDHKVVSLDEAMDEALLAADEASRRDGPAGLSTGFPDIDERLGGLEDGTLTIMAARPGMGKTALGLAWALAAARQGVGVMIVSLEMSARELGRRTLAAAAGVPVVAMKRGKFTVAQGNALVAARKELDSLPLSIEDGAGLTAAMIDLKARAARRRHGLGLIMVDHLHIVRPEDADVRNGATWAVGRISGAMKRMAKHHACPVLLLAQLNRGPEGRDDKRPALADLRQAGDIEQDADVVSFVYRPEYYMRNEPEQAEGETPEKHQTRLADFRHRREAVAGKAELILAKVRDGSPGTVDLRFCGETTSFMQVLQ